MTRRKGKARQPRARSTTKPAGTNGDLLNALGLLRQRRAPYADLLKEIVSETLERFPLPPGQPIVEIGSGTGQLRDWLPSSVRERVVHTDPLESALRELRHRAPEARTEVASAERLAFLDDGSCGGVLGLCVFDAISDQAAVVAEMGRALCPGGRFVHFMDMATLLEAPFEKLAASGLVPIPNVFGDPADHEWPLDIVLVKREWLAGLLSFAARIAHPLSTAFGGYFGAFLDQPERFDAVKATSIFKSIASNGESRNTLLTMLESAGQLAFRQGYPAIEPLPFHSARYLKSVIDTSFRESDTFRIERSEIVARSVWRPRRDSATNRYQSLCVGHQRISDQFPRRLLTDSARERLGPGVPAGETLIEAGVFVFVARRV